jgi:hypothetical protein
MFTILLDTFRLEHRSLPHFPQNKAGCLRKVESCHAYLQKCKNAVVKPILIKIAKKQNLEFEIRKILQNFFVAKQNATLLRKKSIKK